MSVKWRFTLSVTDTSHSVHDNSILTISWRPCSAAHIRAVLPSSSCMFRSAPHSKSNFTISVLPWETANIRVVWPCCERNNFVYNNVEIKLDFYGALYGVYNIIGILTIWLIKLSIFNSEKGLGTCMSIKP